MSNDKSETLSVSPVKVVIIGAGAGGLSCSIYLKEKLGYTNFTVYEKAAGVGGTWRGNIYPGCASDVGVAFYSLSTDLNDWSASHAPSHEIREYWEGLEKKYNLRQHITFNTKVTSAKWNGNSQSYDISLMNVVTGEESFTTAEIVISAIGVLEHPRYADIPGVGDFEGKLFHSAKWDKTVELCGKRVGVVGNGASATQFVPLISEDKSVSVVQFCRTPNWFFPNLVHRYSGFRRWIRRNVPFFITLERWGHFLRHEFLYLTVFSNSISRNLLNKVALSYILYMAPKQYQHKLIPNFSLGCKRIIFDTNYLSSLHRPNLDMNWDGIDRIVKEGILTKKGELVPLDVLIFATGYSADKYQLPIIGRDGTSIQQYYDSQHGAKAYLGTAIPGFPNFFTILGPNTVTGHTSVFYTNEVQINYILQLIKPIIERRIPSIEVDERATDEYNDKLQGRLSTSVFTQCLSWYRDGQKGKITNAFPGSGTTFWYWLRKPDWTHYHTATTTAQAKNWLKNAQRKQETSSFLLKSAAVFHLVCFIALWRNPTLPVAITSWFVGKGIQ